MPSKSSFIAFIKSIVSFRGDLSTVTAPTFLLQPQSYTEYAGLWASQPSLFVASAGESDPAKRAVLVLKWFLSTIRPRLYGRNEKPLAKKPLNPFFGELYLGRWEDEESGRTEMYVEQVGHHPPCTAICVRNDRHGVKLQGYVSLRSHFSGSSIVINNTGHMSLRLDTYDEEYIFTLCPGVISGLFTGKPYPDLAGEITMYASTSFTAQASFAGKGWLSGKRNSVSATLRSGTNNRALYSIEGSWLDELTIKDLQSDAIISTHKICVSDQLPVTTIPPSEQDHWETQRAWRTTAAAILAGDSSAASHAKLQIENGQRQMRIKEHEEGRRWVPIFFATGPATGFLATLVRQGALVPEEDKTGGIWRFNEATREAERPFHPGLTPGGFM